MILEVIKETKRYGHTRTVGRTAFIRMDNVKTVYPPTNTVCRDIITMPPNSLMFSLYMHVKHLLGQVIC